MTPPSNATPPLTQAVAQRLLRGYQFSPSDAHGEDADAYAALRDHFDWFRDHLALFGFDLIRDDEVMLLEGRDKTLSNEEKQTIVLLFLLTDLWLEAGRPFADLFVLRVAWRELDWFRPGAGREYLAQVGVEPEGGLDTIEALWSRVARRGIVEVEAASGAITLRRPAERILNIARRLHASLAAQQVATAPPVAGSGSAAPPNGAAPDNAPPTGAPTGAQAGAPTGAPPTETPAGAGGDDEGQ